jgi:hypothetical protein
VQRSAAEAWRSFRGYICIANLIRKAVFLIALPASALRHGSL